MIDSFILSNILNPLHPFYRMKEQIVAVSGVYDSGKTTTLRLVRDKLISDLGGKIVGGYNGAGDIKLVIDIKGFKIGIETQGDPGGRLKASLEEFVRIHCEVVICACRSYGKTRDCVTSLGSTHDVVILDKGRAVQGKEQQENEKYRDRVVGIVRERLDQLSRIAA